jgi:CRISPR-associated protein Cas1
MTLKGKKNHYNIKLLRGYGVSIRLKDRRIILKNGQDDITGKSEIEEWFITNLPYEKIVISGKGYVSTEAISLLNQNNRNVVLVDTYGHPVSLMNGTMESLTATRHRMAQYDTFRDPEKCLYLQRWIVSEKIKSQIEFLKSIGNDLVREGISKLQWHLGQVDKSEPQRIEAPSSHVYFNNFAKLVPEKFGFQSRNNSSIRTTKRNASDVINALLNYGYAVLAGEISKFVCGFGLDAYYGFYHRSHTGFQPLVYDMMEPFRWLVEYSVYKFANQHEGKRIRMKDYVFTRDGKVVMDSDLIRRFLEILERKFLSERSSKFKHGKKRSDGMSMCQEITIVKLFINRLVDFCLKYSDYDCNTSQTIDSHIWRTN